MTPLDLKRSVVLERFELSITRTGLPLAYGWIYEILQSITSPVFDEFVIWVLDVRYPPAPMNDNDWKAVDELLVFLAERNPGIRLVLTGDGDWSSIASSFPLSTSEGLLRTRSTRVENRFKKFGVL